MFVKNYLKTCGGSESKKTNRRKTTKNPKKAKKPNKISLLKIFSSSLSNFKRRAKLLDKPFEKTTERNTYKKYGTSFTLKTLCIKSQNIVDLISPFLVFRLL